MRLAALFAFVLASTSASAQEAPAAADAVQQMSGEIRETSRGLVFVREGEKAPAVPLTNSADYSRAVVGLPVVATIRQTPAGATAEKIELEPVASLTGGGLPFDVDTTRVRNAVASLRNASARAFRRGVLTAQQADAELRIKLDEAEAAFAAAYLSANRDARAQLIEPLREVKKTQKALYLRQDIYRPEAYRRIFENSRGAVGLARKNEPHPYCSGVLVAANIVLTAAHCLAEVVDPAGEIEVRFNFEVDLAGNALPEDKYPIVREIGRGVRAFDPDGPATDFAVLELGAGAAGRPAGDAWPIQCLSTTRVRRDEPLYVIGHPEGRPRSIHDNAFVYFPFQVTERELTTLRALVEAEVADDPMAKKHLAEFAGSYRLRPGAGPPVYENYSVRWEKQPTIGADSDTYHGNSGSAVFSRQDHRIVGILFAGEEDSDAPWTPGWRAHEAILPVTVVVNTLDATQAGWRNWPRICVN